MRASNIATPLSVFCACAGIYPFLAVSDAADNPDDGDRCMLGKDILKKDQKGGQPYALTALHVNDCRHGSAEFNLFLGIEADDMCKLPHAPQIHGFDEAIIGMCGNWGYAPNKRDFLDMLENSSAAEVVQRIYDGLSHEVFATDADLVLFKEELAELWSGGNGAASAFCGVPSSEEPRGMHFYGRYVEAQDKQWVERNYDGLENADDWDFAPSAKFVIPGGGVRVSNKEEVEVNFSHAGDIMRATETYNGLAPSLLYDEGKLCVYKSDEGHVYAPAVATSGGKEKPRILLPGPVALVGDAGVLLYE